MRQEKKRKKKKKEIKGATVEAKQRSHPLTLRRSALLQRGESSVTPGPELEGDAQSTPTLSAQRLHLSWCRSNLSDNMTCCDPFV